MAFWVDECSLKTLHEKRTNPCVQQRNGKTSAEPFTFSAYTATVTDEDMMPVSSFTTTSTAINCSAGETRLMLQIFRQTTISNYYKNYLLHVSFLFTHR